MGALGAFFTNLVQAKFGIGDVWSYIVTTYYSITENPTVSSIWNAVMNAVAGQYKLFVGVFVCACIAIAFFGHKIMSVLKFVFNFVVGFSLGVYWFAGIIPDAVPIPPWIVGLVIALVLAVLYRFVYIGLYSVTIGYCIYVLCYHGFYIKGGFFTAGKPFLCLIVALLIVGAALALKRYIEMLGTAVFGAWAATSLFAYEIYNYTRWGIFGGHAWIGIFILMTIISLAGFIHQVKTRSRY